MCGRGNRPCPEIGKKYYYLLDYAGNIGEFGLPVISRNYPFGPQPKKKKKGEAPTKECPICGSIIPAMARKCVAPVYKDLEYVGVCGHEFPFSRKYSESNFVEYDWEQILELNAYQISEKFRKKGATIADIYDAYKAKVAKAAPEKKLGLAKWFYHNLYELHGRAGLEEFAASTGRNVDLFLENVQKNTNLNIY